MGKTGLQLLTATLLACVACILLAAFVGPYVVKRGLQNFLAQQDGQNPVIGATRFNPFTLSAGLDDLRLSGADGATVLAVDNTRLDFSILSLFRQHIILNEVSLQNPRLSLNVSSATSRQLFSGLVGTLLPDEDAAGGTLGIRIERASVHGGEARLYDSGSIFEGQKGERAGKTEMANLPELSFSELELQVNNFQSGSDEAAGLALSAKVNESATFRAEGQLVPLTGAFATSVQVAGLDLARFRTLIRSNLAGARLTGILQADGLLSHHGAESHFAGELAIDGFEAGAVSDGRPVFSAEQLSVSGADISARPLRASVKFMQLKRPMLQLALAATAGNSGSMPVLSHWLRDAFGPLAPPAESDAHKSGSWLPTIEALVVSEGRVSLLDPRPTEPVRIELDHVKGAIIRHAAGRAGAQGRSVIAQLSGTVGDSGPVILDSLVQLSSGQTNLAGELEGRHKDGSRRNILGAIELQQADASLFSGYFEQFAARKIVSGTLNLGLRYYLKDDAIAVASKVSLNGLMLGKRSGSGSGEDLPLELALALLADPYGEISFELPILSRTGNPVKTIESAIAGFVSAVSSRPWDMMASLAGMEATALNVVGFGAGSAAITPAAEQQLRAIGEALRQRPALGLRVTAGHARPADRAALARQQIQLHVALAASTRPSGRPEQTVLDFTDPKVQVVLDEFASARLAAGELLQLRQHQGLNGETGTPVSDPEAYYRKVFDALVGQEQVGDKALRQLARYRAQAVIGQLESLGIEAGRLQLGGVIEADDQPVLLEVFSMAATAAGFSDSDRTSNSAAALSLVHRTVRRNFVPVRVDHYGSEK